MLFFFAPESAGLPLLGAKKPSRHSSVPAGLVRLAHGRPLPIRLFFHIIFFPRRTGRMFHRSFLEFKDERPRRPFPPSSSRERVSERLGVSYRPSCHDGRPCPSFGLSARSGSGRRPARAFPPPCGGEDVELCATEGGASPRGSHSPPRLLVWISKDRPVSPRVARNRPRRAILTDHINADHRKDRCPLSRLLNFLPLPPPQKA